MGKVKSATAKSSKARMLASAAKVPAMVMAAALTPEQARRFEHVEARVPNPLGEVYANGEVKAHRACRRLPYYQTLHRIKVIDDATFAVLDWYAGRLGLAGAGLFKSCLDMAPMRRPAAGIDARSDLQGARAAVRPALLPAFDAVMHDGETFEQAGERLYPALSRERARRLAGGEFKAAAAMMVTTIGPRLMLMKAA